MRFLRIHRVQIVVDSPTQLSGRGFPYIFYMKLVLSQLYVFLVLQNGSWAVIFEFVFEIMCCMLNFDFLEIVKCKKAQTHHTIKTCFFFVLLV